MKTSLRTIAILTLLTVVSRTPNAPGATILQAPGSTSVAFEAEENVSIVAGTPTSWAITNDVTPSGSKALFASGANNTAYPVSFASYPIRFATPGTYRIYFRWRANEVYTDADPNSANSFFAPIKLDANTSADNPNADYTVSTVNNTRVKPESNSYHVDTDNTAMLVVSQDQVDAGLPLTFTLGTREAGMMIDRFVLSQDSSLSEAQFNAAPNADTTIFVQPAGANYVAFEAESPKVTIIGGTPTSWAITNDVTPSGNTALFESGVNNTAFPVSFASYAVQFATPGTYKLFFRWRANEVYTDADPNSANSFFAPNTWNANTNPINPNPDFTASTVNNTRVRPESNTYHVDPENNNLLTVSQDQVDARVPLIFSLGTREAGMMLDRIVLTLDAGLTEPQFNALENTGAVVPPQLTAAVGSASLATVKLTFTKALDAFSTDPSNFKIDGNVDVLAATLDPVSLKEITLNTSRQTEGALYTVTVNGLTDLAGNYIPANSKATFYAWQLAPGFSHRDLFFTITGSDVDSLLNSGAFPNSPNRSDVVKGLSFVNEPRAQNFGVRLTGFFIPDRSGFYDFFIYNDNDARLSISLDDTADLLAPVISSPTTLAMSFDPAVTGRTASPLASGQRYFIEVLVKQGADYDSFVNVAARHESDTTPAPLLPPLAGNQIGTLIDPSLLHAEMTRQPASVTLSAGNRVRFEAAAKSPGGLPFYQWQVNGQDIPGATRAAYYTPVLQQEDSGKQYRCVVYCGGSVLTSAVATATVSVGPVPRSQPYVGISFVGGDAAGASGTLRANDVVGVVPQANFNNLTGGTGADVPLVDASGAPADVTATYDGRTYFTGSGENTAEDVLFQGYLHNANGTVTVTLKNVPQGVYDLYAYAVGFNYNATYEQAMDLLGAIEYPVFHVRAEHAANYAAAPSIFRRMTSTDANARDQGNYVVFENVGPDFDGKMTLTVINESDNPNDIDVTPTLSGLQLVKAAPQLASSPEANGLRISWSDGALNYTLESSDTLGSGAAWRAVSGVANPLPGAGSVVIPLNGTPRALFFRLHQ